MDRVDLAIERLLRSDGLGAVDAGSVIGAATSVATSFIGAAGARNEQRARFRAQDRAARSDLQARAQQAANVGVNVGIPWVGIGIGATAGVLLIGAVLSMAKPKTPPPRGA